MAKYELDNEEFEMALIAMRCHGHPKIYALADRLEAEAAKRVCPASADSTHDMVQPEDTERVKWGDFGICEQCHMIRRME